MPTGRGVPTRIPQNPVDAMSSSDFIPDAYKRLFEQRTRQMIPTLSPEGRQVALSTPFEVGWRGSVPPDLAGRYYPGPNRVVMFNSNPDVFRHEYGHALGFAQSPTGFPSGFAENATPNLTNTPFPGMFGNPYGEVAGRSWGGPMEYYAKLQERPYLIPESMRQYFPQFRPEAYNPPPGYSWQWRSFEDGSSGWVLAPGP